MGCLRSECFAVLIFGSSLGCIIGCPKNQGPHPGPPLYDAVAAGKKAISEFDINGDGKIAGAELERCPGLKAAIDQINPKGLNGITGEMIVARIQAWEKSKVGRMFIRCVVSHNGIPMSDVDIKFVPEKFLGENALVAIGRTNKHGVTIISHPEFDALGRPPGVLPGFYRIEIKKRGENIPSKYDAETVLGQEIAIDANGLTNNDERTLVFNLKY